MFLDLKSTKDFEGFKATLSHLLKLIIQFFLLNRMCTTTVNSGRSRFVNKVLLFFSGKETIQTFNRSISEPLRCRLQNDKLANCHV